MLVEGGRRIKTAGPRENVGEMGSILEFCGGFTAGQSKWPTSGFWAVGAMAGLWGLETFGWGAGSFVYQTGGCKI